MMPHEINVAHHGDTLSARGGDGFTVVTIRGELGIAAVPALREQLLVLLASGADRIVVDLSRVTFCDSSGLAVLVGAGRRAGLLGGVLRLAAAAPSQLTIADASRLRTQNYEAERSMPPAPAHATARPARTLRCSNARYAHSGAAIRARRSYVAR